MAGMIGMIAIKRDDRDDWDERDDWGWLRMTKDDERWWGWQGMTGMIGMFEKNGMTGISKDDWDDWDDYDWMACLPEKNGNEWEKQFQQLRDRFLMNTKFRDFIDQWSIVA